MKVYIYEPDLVQSRTGINTSERVDHFMKVLSKYNPRELRQIRELRDKGLLSDLDKSSNIIIAHFTDVQSSFHELKKFSSALCIFHTYDSGWYPGKINSNSICVSINNKENRFCIGSSELKINIKSFIDDFVETGKVSLEKLYGKSPVLQSLLQPFSFVLPLEEYWDKGLNTNKTALHECLS